MMKRRDILRNGALAGAAALLSVPGASAAGADLHLPVLAALSAYSRNVESKIHGGTVRIVASIDDMRAFCDPAVRRRAFPYPGMSARGNVISFSHQSIDYEIASVLPSEFAAACGISPHTKP